LRQETLGRVSLALMLCLAGATLRAGNGDLVSFDSPRVYNDGSGFNRAIAVADFNGDGRPDMALSYSAYSLDSSFVLVYLGNGNGTFQPPVKYTVPYAYARAVGDFNGDGKPDLAVSGKDRIWILLGNGHGTFQQPRSFFCGGSGISAVVGDFNARRFSLPATVPSASRSAISTVMARRT
jgi:hypothetical protein